MDVYIVVHLDLLRCDQSSAVHRDPGEIDWRKCRPRSSYNLAPSLHSSLTRQVGSTTILESLLWWHPRHEQWHTSMITSSAFKVNRFFFYYLKKYILLSHSRSWLSWKILHEKGWDEQHHCSASYLGRNPWLFCLREYLAPWQQQRKTVCLLAGLSSSPLWCHWDVSRTSRLLFISTKTQLSLLPSQGDQCNQSYPSLWDEQTQSGLVLPW